MSFRSPIFTGARTRSSILKGSPDAATNCIGSALATDGILGACESTSCRTNDTDDQESNITSTSTPPMIPLVVAALFLTTATTTPPGFIDVRGVRCPPREPLGRFPNGSLVRSDLAVSMRSTFAVRCRHPVEMESRSKCPVWPQPKQRLRRVGWALPPVYSRFFVGIVRVAICSVRAATWSCSPLSSLLVVCETAAVWFASSSARSRQARSTVTARVFVSPVARN